MLLVVYRPNTCEVNRNSEVQKAIIDSGISVISNQPMDIKDTDMYVSGKFV